MKLIQTIKVGNSLFGLTELRTALFGLTQLRGNIVVFGATMSNMTTGLMYSERLHFYNASTFVEQKVIDLDKTNVPELLEKDVELTSLAGDDATNSIFLRVPSCRCVWKFADDIQAAQKWIHKYTWVCELKSWAYMYVKFFFQF